ncbi:hypothetical protein AMAG_08418 [Allomyces macrogynus ATCC 38327]|uniref:HMG box domain-containing protein n=1 Tax=Allomyces macrogynus (strain ATCC 38327) TaxID=578462 RepID=A0A0L0SL34_ALLM3|nr:hypothetical protein AMAG_08418 [Allomyces macrogynus ATCC 38327]|eukprot:KNE63276.1 hypothetical protein AMAG_08418 [Allomyces macrogynus ATCC 38327]
MLRTSTTTLARAMAALRIAPAVVRPTAARVLAVTPRFYQTTPAVHAAATGAGSEEVPEPPKRPPNSFALFTADMSAKRPADVRPRDWFKQLKPMWDALSESGAFSFAERAAAKKAGPKRPLNAFQMFMMDQRPNMPADIQRDMTKVATEASRLWKELPESGKKEYQARNREAMRKYMLEVAMGEGKGGAASE